MHRRLILALCAALLSTAACAANEREAAALADSRVSVVVENQNFSDVTIYSVRQGTRARVGWVPGNSTGRFTVSAAQFPTGELNLVALPLTGGGAAYSGPVLVGGGQTVYFTVASQLRASFARTQ